MCLKRKKNSYDTTLDKLYDLIQNDVYDSCDEDNYIDEIAAAEEALFAKLTKEQQEEYERIDSIKNNRHLEIYKNIFIYTYKLATRLLCESIYTK